MKNNRFTTAQLTLLGLMAAILLLMAYTPLGYLNIGPLAISFNVIPVAISAVVLGLWEEPWQEQSSASPAFSSASE